MAIDPKTALEILKQGGSMEEAGRRFGVSRQRVQQVLADYPPYKDYLKEKERLQAEIERKIAAMALKFSVPQIAKKLGKKESYVRFIAAKNRISVPRKRSSIVGKKFGAWLVLKELGYKVKGEDRYVPEISSDASTLYVLARCTKCGKIYPVSHFNLVRQRSKACQSCAAKGRSSSAAAKKRKTQPSGQDGKR